MDNDNRFTVTIELVLITTVSCMYLVKKILIKLKIYVLLFNYFN